MKEFIKFISKVTGILRSVVTIVFLLAIIFTALVDANLLVAFVDMLGFTGISAAIIKPIFFIIFGLMFIINLIITRNIFNAGETGRYHVSNLVFGLLFLALDAFIYVTLRGGNSPIIYGLFAINGLVALNSILGLIARARGEYIVEEEIDDTETTTEYIEFEEEPVRIEPVKEVIRVKEEPSKNPKVIKETKISPTGEVATKTEIAKEIQKSETPGKTILEKDQKMVFESKGQQKEVSTNSKSTEQTDPSQTTTIKRVAKKKDKGHTEKIRVTDATNKVSRGEAISTEEIYESKSREE